MIIALMWLAGVSWEMIKLCCACMPVYVTNQVYWLLVVYPTGQARSVGLIRLQYYCLRTVIDSSVQVMIVLSNVFAVTKMRWK